VPSKAMSTRVLVVGLYSNLAAIATSGRFVRFSSTRGLPMPSKCNWHTSTCCQSCLLPILLVAHLAFCPGGVGQGKVAAFSFPCRRHVQFQPDRQHCPAMGPYLQCWSPYLAGVEAMVCVCVCFGMLPDEPMWLHLCTGSGVEAVTNTQGNFNPFPG